MDGLKRGSAAIVGVAESDLGQVADGMSPIDLMAQGIQRALDDCGLDAEGRRRPVLRRRRRAACRSWRWSSISASSRRSSARPSSAARRSSITSRTRWRAIAPGLCNVAVIAYGSTQRSVGRKQASRARVQPVRDAVQAVPAVQRLCAGGLAPHARVRHHARAARRGRGRGAPMGAAQSGRLGEEAAHHRRRALRAHDELSVHGARLLPRHRRRRRDRHDVGRARAVAEESAGLCARLRPVASRTPTSPACRT